MKMPWALTMCSLALAFSGCASSVTVESGATEENGVPTDSQTTSLSPATVVPEVAEPVEQSLPAGLGGSTRTDCDLTGWEGLPEVPNDAETNPAFARANALNDPMNAVQILVHGIEITEDNEGLDDFDWGADYAGITWDWEQDKAVLFLTEGSSIDLAPLYGAFPDGEADLRIEYVPYSYEQLDTWRQMLNDSREERDLSGASLSEVLNRVTVRAEDPTEVDLTSLLPSDAFCVELVGDGGDEPADSDG